VAQGSEQLLTGFEPATALGQLTPAAPAALLALLHQPGQACLKRLRQNDWIELELGRAMLEHST